MIRPFDIADVPAITEIYNHYVLHTDISFETEPLSVQQMRQRLEDIAAFYPVMVDCEENDMRGYCYAHLWKERAAYVNTWEATVYLAPAYVRKGIGTQLMKALIDHCRQAGCHALVSCVTGGNMASYALHERLGFRKVSQFVEVGQKFGRWLDVVDYQLLL